MKISTEIYSSAIHVGEEKAVELCAKAGFDCWDFSMFKMCPWEPTDEEHPLKGDSYLKFARQLKKIGLDNGIVCNQSHAPFPTRKPEVRSYLKRAIECTAEAGGSICIIHPDNDSDAEKNAEFYMELLPFAKECGVKIATENMWNWKNGAKQSCFAACATSKSFLEHLNAVNDPYLVACLDLGHAEMRGSGDGASKMIMDLGSHLQALHIHDNDLLNDSHQLPFSMNIDFAPIAKALKDIDYKGVLTLECDNYLSAYNKDNVLDGLKIMAGSARRLDEMIKGS